MFCPKCSQIQPAEDLRFCPRCGFPLAAVRELFGREEGRGVGNAWALPAQKEVATGALLMFAGSVVAVLWGFMGTRGPAETLLPQAYFIMGGTLAFLVTLFHPLLRSFEGPTSGVEPSPCPRGRRDGINLGALLMFVGALKAMLFTSYMHAGPERGVTTLLFMAGILTLVLLLRPILSTAHGLFFRREAHMDSVSISTTTQLDSRAPGAALPPAHSISVDAFAPSRDAAAGMPAPPSITEDTTRKLNV